MNDVQITEQRHYESVVNAQGIGDQSLQQRYYRAADYGHANYAGALPCVRAKAG
jgi:hypothetical protein